VRTEARADTLEEGDEFARLEVLRAVERHVLEEVRQAALVVLLVDRADIDRQPQRHATCRARVAADVITASAGCCVPAACAASITW
jgi:hypothetical protein